MLLKEAHNSVIPSGPALAAMILAQRIFLHPLSSGKDPAQAEHRGEIGERSLRLALSASMASS